MNDYYVHRNSGNAIFVKEAEFFVKQGGATEPWGRNWKRIQAESIEDARKRAEEVV